MNYEDENKNTEVPDCIREITAIVVDKLGHKEFTMICRGAANTKSKTLASDSYKVAINLANASIEMNEWRFATEVLRRFFEAFSNRTHLFTMEEIEEIECLHNYVRETASDIPQDPDKLF